MFVSKPTDESYSSFFLLINDSVSFTKPASTGNFSAGNYGQRIRQIKTKRKEMMKSVHTKLHSL